ncbi:hypothetical protein IL38_24200 [Actinopolyspora erythraea]|uniref:MarR family transcriptional regulator n=1 Tax=Actinopolyspora erythraea TaxID=414996 RepID=A0ABR4WYE0_9ACTN|nr:hypothetical protein [Actinopolyspora erythraea]KGI79399.1 hypothetical protein IL38_24200 [Actinopolyspora erythraea]
MQTHIADWIVVAAGREEVCFDCCGHCRIDVLAAWSGQSHEVARRAVEQAGSRGLVDWTDSPRWFFPTRSGLALVLRAAWPPDTTGVAWWIPPAPRHPAACAICRQRPSTATWVTAVGASAVP